MHEEGKEPLEQLYSQPCFAVMPIFDSRKLVWGYELSLRNEADSRCGSGGERDLAGLSAVGTFLMNPTLDRSSKKAALLLPFSQAAMLDDESLELPYRPSAVIVDEKKALEEGLLEGLARLKNHKHWIAIDNLILRPGCEELLRCADVAFIDISAKGLPEIGRIVQKLLPLGTVLGAKGVESPEQFLAAKDLGFTLFHGGFFQKPELTPGKKLASSTLSRFRLCRMMTDEYPNLDELTTIIQSDVALSYRFLSFVNSAAFGFHQKIDSVKRAFIHIGWEKMKNWLWVMVIADIQPKGKTSELPYLSAIRGKFLESLALENKRVGVRSESLLLLGLFSLLEPMLDLPAQQIMESLPLDEEVKAALCHEQNEYSDWLDVARCFESGDWNRLDLLIERLGLDPMKAASAYCKAIVWTKSFYAKPEDSPRQVHSRSAAKVGPRAVSSAPPSDSARKGEGILQRIGAAVKSIFLFWKK